ncbi:catalase family peroxidase [Dechloromonas sp. XY25]|uniref:Catalase-related peroxidase n=1 Tax=Dechloromonas hankyongensis TaxID=2908002 RepID=A0ABS9JZP9_9RHOO|nr:catalase family peroxidase [Dechloromonas hankyongensis]MCG2576351.1 catalase family peroxidase [Dechloromonas hankyongensis]
MQKTSLATPMLALAALIISPPLLADNAQPGADLVVGAIEGVFGVTPGERRNHIKGTCAAGEFVGTRKAARLSKSPLFSGKPVPVVARFSVSGGNTKVPDVAKSGRGMALEFQLPKGKLHHITMLNTPMFGAAQPQTFLDLMLALKPDPATGKPDPEKMKAFKASHPDNLAQADYLASNNPPASYASSSYWGIHTFKFIDKKGTATLVRWQFVPQDGEKRLSDDELKTAGANFLESALIERTKQGPARWDMLVSIGQPGDSETDPTVLWPAERPRIKAGTLTISRAEAQKGAPCEPINFDPLVMAPGIQPTDDPILRFRSPTYAVSFGKRLSER